MSIVFAHFYRWATALCPGANEFHCDNSKCIKASLRCDGFDHCGDRSDEICHLPDMLQDIDDNWTSFLTVLIALALTMLILAMLIVLASKAARRHVMLRLRRGEGSIGPGADDSLAANARAEPREVVSANARAPTIQTIGDRRFYVVSAYSPSSQLRSHITSIIEAPPTYADALKHSVLIEARRLPPAAYNNLAFRLSPVPPQSTTNQEQPATPQIPRNSNNRVQATIDVLGSQNSEDQEEIVSTLPNLNRLTQPGNSTIPNNPLIVQSQRLSKSFNTKRRKSNSDAVSISSLPLELTNQQQP